MNVMNLRIALRNFLLDNTSIPETAFIFEEEKWRFPDSLDYVVKEWLIDVEKNLPTDDSKLWTVTIELDVIQREDAENDFITAPMWEIMNCIDKFNFEGALVAKPTLTSSAQGTRAILIEIPFLNKIIN